MEICSLALFVMLTNHGLDLLASYVVETGNHAARAVRLDSVYLIPYTVLIMAQKSDVYVSDYSNSVLRSHSLRTAANSAGYLLSSILPNMQICDIGCGPGTITTDLAALVPHGQVFGIDMGQEAVEKARSMAAERDIKNVVFDVGDAHALNFPDHTFDVVHCHQLLQHIADPVSALREWCRVTKPGGIVACRESDFETATHYPETKGITDFKDVYIKTARSRGGEPNGGRHLTAWARESGIDRSRITATASVWCYSSPEERAYWGDMWANRLMESSLGRNTIDGGFATQDDIDRFVQGWREWVADDDGWYTLTHGEILCRV